MGFKSDIRRSLRVIERELECPKCIWNRKALVCVPSTIKASKDLSRGGFAPQDSLVLRVRLDQFGPQGPFAQLKDTVTYQGYDYTIQDINQPPGDSFVEWVMEDPNRGA